MRVSVKRCIKCLQAAWARSPQGAAAIRGVYSRSTALDGEAIVVFVRALCAVSQEELVPLLPVDPIR